MSHFYPPESGSGSHWIRIQSGSGSTALIPGYRYLTFIHILNFINQWEDLFNLRLFRIPFKPGSGPAYDLKSQSQAARYIIQFRTRTCWLADGEYRWYFLALPFKILFCKNYRTGVPVPMNFMQVHIRIALKNVICRFISKVPCTVLPYRWRYLHHFAILLPVRGLFMVRDHWVRCFLSSLNFVKVFQKLLIFKGQ